METIASLSARHARAGRLDWIGLRPARLAELRAVTRADLTREGLSGDHARAGKRAVTLVQAEHLPAVAALARLDGVAPETLRRNLVVSGINLAALRGRPVRIGAAILQLTVPCAPCSRMEAALGPGGYNALRNHGGWCAEVIRPARLEIGDAVMPDASSSSF
jgi:MOSC domain-containing protein YiiM